jgi:PadR family transcriptional regulator, regulatory protein PadR
MIVPRLSPKEYRILDLLRSGVERYGLEMVKESDGALKRGTVYVTLTRMVEKGYLRSRQEREPTEPGLPRRLYQITGSGLQMLNAIDLAASMLGDRTHA